MSGINLHVYPTPIVTESRMFRITETLERNEVFDEIVLLGTEREGLPATEQLSARRRIVRVGGAAASGGFVAKVTRMARWGRAIQAHVGGWGIVCVNAHSLSVLPLCVSLAERSGAKLVYDTHELETETLHSRGARKVLAKVVEARLIRRAHAVSAVNRHIAEWYRHRYGLPEVTIVRNAPVVGAARPRPSGALRARFDIPADAIVFLYQGMFARGRGVGAMLQAFAAPGRHHIVFVGFGPLRDEVQTASTRPSARVHLIDAVPLDELRRLTVDADVGFAVLDDTCLNHRLALPNKFFDYASLGVPIAATPGEAMREELARTGGGWTMPGSDASAIGAFVAGLTPEEVRERRAAAELHADEFRWETEEAGLLRMYAALGFAA